MNEQELGQEMNEKGLNAPRVTSEMIDEMIVHEAYYVFPGTTVTICCLTLRNGFNTVGESAAVSLENFDQDIGQRVAREDARNKIWALAGFRLKHMLWVASLFKERL